MQAEKESRSRQRSYDQANSLNQAETKYIAKTRKPNAVKKNWKSNSIEKAQQ